MHLAYHGWEVGSNSAAIALRLQAFIPGLAVSQIDLPTRDCRCPRCGYDQRGIIETWKDSCPLEGVCAECGLHWAWGELLNPRVAPPRWCVEFANAVQEVPWRSFRTLVKVYWPWGFWKSVKMIDEPRWRLIVAHLFMWLAICYLMFAIVHGAAAWRDWHAVTAIAPVPASSTTPIQAALRAAVLPLSQTAPATAANANVNALGGLFVHWRYRSPFQLFQDYWADWFGAVAVMLVFLTMCGVAFAALPQSRRMAKVRWSHILRVTLHSFVLLVPPTLMFTFAIAVGNPSWLVPLMNSAGLLLLLTFPLAFVWWSIATQHYLKMRHTWLVGLAVVIMSGLFTVCAFLYWVLRHDFGTI